jgi:ParB family chromosome partitioning protein
MGYIENFDLEKILPNPYQTRLSEDAEHIQNLAQSIEEVGILQTPTGRVISPYGEVQLAFGHSRLAAMRKLCQEKGDGQYAQMAVNIQSLTDEQMFIQAVTENHDRKDLSPIETARAMKIYRDKFGKTSREIGQLFHLSASAVRNKMRLLDLPDPVQEKVDRGQITEGSARSLLQIQRVDPTQSQEIIDEILEDRDEIDTVEIEKSVDSALRYGSTSKAVIRLHGSWEDDPPRAGTGLWELAAWRPEIPEVMTDDRLDHDTEMAELFAMAFNQYPEEVRKAWSNDDPYALFQRLSNHRLSNALDDEPEDWRYQFEHIDSRLLDIYSVLVDQAQTCSNCPLHVVRKGNHVCGFPACHQWRETFYKNQQLMYVSACLDVEIYDKEQDGGCKSLKDDYMTSWRFTAEQREDVMAMFQVWLASAPEKLRVRLTKPTGYEFPITDNKLVEIVCVGKEAIAALEKVVNEEDKGLSEYDIRSANRAASVKFIEKVVIPVFQQAVVNIDPNLMRWAFGTYYSYPQDESEDDQLAYAQRKMTNMFLDWRLNYEDKAQGPEWLANTLKMDAKAIGVDLPHDWDERARQYRPTILDDVPDDVEVEKQ